MPNENVPSQTERAFRQRFVGIDSRLKELERRLSGIGTGDTALGAAGPTEFFTSSHVDYSVASGAFPATPSTPGTFVPTQDCALAIGFLNVIMSWGPGTSDMGCNIGIDTGGGFGFQWICSIGNTQLYADPAAGPSSVHLTMHGFETGLAAGQEFQFRHEYYNPDSNGAGTVGMASSFTLVAFVSV